MLRCLPPTALAALVFAAASTLALPVRGEVFQCQRGELLRRVELQFADDADRLPCEVVYWKDSESPEQPQLLWKAENDVQFCVDKAEGVVGRLKSAGWSCTAATTPGASDQAQLTAPPPMLDSGPDSGPDAAPDAAILDEQARVAPATLRPPSGPDSTILAAAVARDVERLKELTAPSAGSFKADTAILGDLDQDGLEDAAVLMTYQAEGVPPAHHLLAYLFDGKTFRPVARINLAASDPKIAGARIQDVSDGVVELQLDLLQANDPPCCPTARERADFVLRHGQLVRLAKDPNA